MLEDDEFVAHTMMHKDHVSLMILTFGSVACNRSDALPHIDQMLRGAFFTGLEFTAAEFLSVSDVVLDMFTSA